MDCPHIDLWCWNFPQSSSLYIWFWGRVGQKESRERFRRWSEAVAGGGEREGELPEGSTLPLPFPDPCPVLFVAASPADKRWPQGTKCLALLYRKDLRATTRGCSSLVQNFISPSLPTTGAGLIPVTDYYSITVTPLLSNLNSGWCTPMALQVFMLHKCLLFTIYHCILLS